MSELKYLLHKLSLLVLKFLFKPRDSYFFHRKQMNTVNIYTHLKRKLILL